MVSMHKLLVALALTAALAAGGCSNGRSRVAGTWKGDIIPAKASQGSFVEGLKGMVTALLGPMTVEFNEDGKYKVSLSVGSGTGTYTVSGNEITLTPDDKSQNNDKMQMKLSKLEISDDGKILHTKKEFESDSVLELKKQPDSGEVH